jgi:hypothetical protein
MKTLFEQFLAEECTPSVLRLLEQAFADPAMQHRHFELNRFEVTVDRITNVVELADVLAPSEAPVERIPLAEFESALARCASS